MSKASDLARLMTSGSTAVHGEAGVTASGSTGLTTNLQQGLAKMWINLDGDASTPAALDSINTGSITDGGAGIYTYNFTNSMGNANYCFQGTAAQIAGSTSSGLHHEPQDNNASYATGSVKCETYYVDSSTNRTNADLSNSNGTVFGDLA
tara:strand:- start:49 stop:498 length:450 start_codon:yes stop_codon:yes gene_type:complete